MKLLQLLIVACLVALLSQSVTAYPSLKMPVMSGESMRCDQGNSDCNPTHCNGGTLRYAWDFNLNGTTGNGDLDLPVVASANGKVVYAQDYSSSPSDPWGKCVVVAYGDDYGLYAHLSQIFLSVQDSVKQGQAIGTLGNADGYYSNAAHLHYQTQSGTNPNGQSVPSSFTDVGTPTAGNTYVSGNSNIFDLSKSTALNNRNQYASSQTPDQWFSGGSAGSIGWYHSYNPSGLYESGTNTAKNCYRSIYSGGTYVGALVYDALGGARHAYCVGYQYWATWDNLAISCSGNCPTPTCGDGGDGEGGPNSVLGMPITNHYQYTVNPDHWRQDFQKGYIEDGTIVKCYTTNAPGWTANGWNNQYSYLFTDAYDRNGGRRDVGNPISGSNGQIHVLSGNILIQDFTGGNDGSGMIMYDLENWACNTSATNEAYWVYGGIKSRYDQLGVGFYGCATIDRSTYNGRVCQDFKNSSGTRYRIYDTGEPVFDRIGTCSGGTFHADGGSSDPFSGQTLSPITGDWNTDGYTEVGIYTQEASRHYLDTDNDGIVDYAVNLGTTGDRPITGDWQGVGAYKIGVYRPSVRCFWPDYNNDGTPDFGMVWGYEGDWPLSGDWDGNNTSTMGIYRPSTRYFWLDNNNDGVADIGCQWGYDGDWPLVGDWDGNGTFTIGIYRPSTRYFWLDNNNDGVADIGCLLGYAGDIPIVGDWDANGTTNIGVFRPSTRYFWEDYNNDGVADRGFEIRKQSGLQKPVDLETLPTTFSLSQNYPNPFNPVTVISYSLPTATHVSLEVYNILGQKVATLVDSKQEAGDYQVQFDCSDCASGIYLYRLATDQAVETKKMALLK